MDTIYSDLMYLNEKTGEVNFINENQTVGLRANNCEENNISSSNGQSESAVDSIDDSVNSTTNESEQKSDESVNSINNKPEQKSDENVSEYVDPTEKSIEILKQQLTKLEERISTEKEKSSEPVEEVEDETEPSNKKLNDELTENAVVEQNEENNIRNCVTPSNENADKSDSTDTISDKDLESEINDSHCVLEESPKKNSKNDGEVDFSDDEDFDPLLLCPEVSMDVDETHAIIPNNSVNNKNSDDKTQVSEESACSSFVDVMTGVEVMFDLTEEEQELRKKLFGKDSPIERRRTHCSACNVHLGTALEGQINRFVHPMLKVLICKDCYHFYASGDFEKDEDGSELYCRWCGQGGNVMCCSKCEFVFCTKCIRYNFGRKKVDEIKKSDDWLCFRCNRSQLTTLRIACYELFDYVRKQTSLIDGGDDAKWSTDHTSCCLNKKHDNSDNDDMVSKAKKKRKQIDPDYNPALEQISEERPTARLVPPCQSTKIINKAIPPVSAPLPNFVINPAAQPSSAGYRPILPNSFKNCAVPMKFSPFVPPPLIQTNRNVPRKIPLPVDPLTPVRKHEWFDKTLRASTRVNSQLSFTLTQLNQAQANAKTIEELAIVHNKLQEVLSSSINSLIQIRRNLRSEFISDIKTVQLPKSIPTTGAPVYDDDDVILISDSVHKPSTSQTNNLKKNNNLPPSLINNKAPLGLIKVKNISDLQGVSSECITIPDDDDLVMNRSHNNFNIMSHRSYSNSMLKKTLLKRPIKGIIKNILPMKATHKLIPESFVRTIQNGINAKLNNNTSSCRDITNIVYNVREEPSKDIKKMLNVTVRLEKNIEDIVKEKLLMDYNNEEMSGNEPLNI